MIECHSDSWWASDRVDRVGQGINTKVNNFRSGDKCCLRLNLNDNSFELQDRPLASPRENSGAVIVIQKR